MTSVAYWTLLADQKGAVNPPDKDNTLIYLLAHASQDAARASFGNFSKDADWQVARKASEEKAGSSLTIKGGVKSVSLIPTDYSAVKQGVCLPQWVPLARGIYQRYPVSERATMLQARKLEVAAKMAAKAVGQRNS